MLSNWHVAQTNSNAKGKCPCKTWMRRSDILVAASVCCSCSLPGLQVSISRPCPPCLWKLKMEVQRNWSHMHALSQYFHLDYIPAISSAFLTVLVSKMSRESKICDYDLDDIWNKQIYTLFISLIYFKFNPVCLCLFQQLNIFYSGIPRLTVQLVCHLCHFYFQLTPTLSLKIFF